MPAGDSSSDGNSGLLAIEPEKLHLSVKGLNEGTGGSPQKEVRSPLPSEKRFPKAVRMRNQSYNDFDVDRPEIEELMDDYVSVSKDDMSSLSSNAQLFCNRFMACESSDSAKSFAMRLSASPFVPKI